MNDKQKSLKRRDFLLMVSGGVTAAGLGMQPKAAAALGHQIDDPHYDAIALRDSEVTPNAEFFSLNYGAAIPDWELGDWSLTIDGLIEGEPQVLRWQDLQHLPTVEEIRTVECIGNPLGGHLIGTARWKGILWRDLLRGIRPKPAATHIQFTAGDGYQTAVRLSQLSRGEALLAYEMNGEPLPREHGFPLRLLIAGVYGQKMPKWITRISFIDYPFKGYWESRGWSEDAEVQTHAVITSPRDHAVVSGRVMLHGIAFGGRREIVKVEVRIDSGAWIPAELIKPATPLAWTRWVLEWQPTGAGSYSLEVRATDSSGFTQSAAPEEKIGVRQRGSTAIHKIIVRVNP